MQYADRVQETTTTAGAGTVTLAGAVSGYRTYGSVIVDQTQTPNCFVDGTAWEVSYGTFSLGANTLSRQILIASSTGSFLVLSGGTVSVFLTAPAPQVDWPTVSNVIASADTVVVPAGRQLQVGGTLTIHGTLQLHGDLFMA